jgi:hypothetical protein
MSALGHKRTYAEQKGMSALPPKTDIRSAVGTDEIFPLPGSPLRAKSQSLHEPGGCAGSKDLGQFPMNGPLAC